MRRVGRYWKAVTGALAPGAVLIVAAVTEGSQGGTTITQAEWITAVATVIISGGAVAVSPPNHPKPTPPVDVESP